MSLWIIYLCNPSSIMIGFWTDMIYILSNHCLIVPNTNLVFYFIANDKFLFSNVDLTYEYNGGKIPKIIVLNPLFFYFYVYCQFFTYYQEIQGCYVIGVTFWIWCELFCTCLKVWTQSFVSNWNISKITNITVTNFNCCRPKI